MNNIIKLKNDNELELGDLFLTKRNFVKLNFKSGLMCANYIFGLIIFGLGLD